MTHDFRSPLTSIEGYAAMLASELSDPVLGDFASRIRSNAVRLMKLVDLMVEHCHMPVGGVGLSVEPVCLATVLRTVVDDLSTTVQGHEVAVQETDVVADRGRGIDPADRETIFDEFNRGRRAADDGGFGLGLAVVRNLVEQHGGSVRIDDGRFGGTDVTVRLPLGPAPSVRGGVETDGLQSTPG